MLIRSRMYLSGNTGWSSITESSTRPIAWVEGEGLTGSFTYSHDENSISIAGVGVSGVSIATLKSVLTDHPEGIVLYCGSGNPHAVFLTDYEEDIFYCADPAWGYSGRRMTLEESLLGARYGTQESILNNVTIYWHVTSYSIINNSYIGKCTYYPAYGAIQVTKENANIMDRPCSTKTDPNAIITENGVLNSEYEVTGLYKNDQGNIWYRITTKTGSIGYIFSENCAFITGLYGDVVLQNPNIPTALSVGTAYNLGGTISSPYSELRGVSFYVYDSSGNSVTGSKVSCSGISYELSNPDIDYNVLFDTLPVGQYQCVVTATVYGCRIYKDDIVGLEYELELLRSDLTINPTSSGGYPASTVVNLANQSVGGSYANGYCLGYVATMFYNAYGIDGNVYSSCCAYQNGSRYITSLSRSNIPLGACVYFGGSTVWCNYCGNYAGHIGIYVGNNNIVHAWDGTIVCTSIDYVISCGYPYRGYGWYAYTELTTESPSTPCTHQYTSQNTPASCTKDGTRVYSCSSCGHQYSETIPALGHNHRGVVTTPTCVSLGYTTYTCSRCDDSYVDTSETVWSGWSTAYPDGIDNSLIETQTQYRHRDREQNWVATESATIAYVPSWPSGFSTSHGLYAQYNKTPKTASETDSQRITVNSDNVIGYIYYHWCRGTYTTGPINRLVGKVCNGEFVTFHAFYSSQDAGHYDGNIGYGTEEFFFSNADCCRDSYWYHQIPVREQHYTIEEKQFDGERWGNWSEWSDTVYSVSDNREVETRTVYRYPVSGLADHSWDNGTVTKKPTATSTGIKTYCCTVCDETMTETIPATSATNNALTDIKLYIPVVEQEIADVLSKYNNEDILNSMAYGQLCDIDDDGVQELLISSQYLFPPFGNYEIHTQQHVYSLYDIVDGRVQTVAWKEPIIADTGDWWGYAGIVLYKGTPVVMTVKVDDGHRPEDAIYQIADSEVTLYDSKNHAPFHTIKISTTDTDINYFIDGQAVTQDAFKQEMSEYTYLELVEDYYLEYTNSKLTLPELLIYLGGNTPSSNPFVDVPSDAFYHDPVLWAVDNSITNGIDATHFGPDAGCTRAHVVTFLWRAAGSPSPSSSYNPFTDVLPGAYYYDAVLWAVEKGITNGTSATTFGPDQTCTRGQIVTFLWRYQHSPSASGATSFTDVPAGQYYSTAVAWAVENEITNGMGNGTFAPDATCTRGQIVTFLYRAMA